MEQIIPADASAISSKGEIKRSNIYYQSAKNSDSLIVGSTDFSWTLTVPYLDNYLDPRVKRFEDIPQKEIDLLSARTILFGGRESWADFWMHYHQGTDFREFYPDLFGFIDNFHNAVKEGAGFDVEN
jgi:hypothetical protein